MFLYYGKTFQTAQSANCIVGIVCDQCRATYYYELARIGTGAGTAAYGIGALGASKRAQDQSQSDLQQRLAIEAELVPCPECDWISHELVKGFRQGRYRRVGKFAFFLGLAGTILSLVVAWFLRVGPQRDRWLVPYFQFGGPASFVGIAMILLLLRAWLRSRIQPNRGWPREHDLPPATPPALVLDGTTKNLRLAKPSSATSGDFLDFQFGRIHMPALCCECVKPASSGRGYSICVSKLIHFSIPRCTECTKEADRKSQSISRNFLKFALLGSVALVAGMVWASIPWWQIVVLSLMLLAFALVVLAMIVDTHTAPAKVIFRDRSRGVVRLRFRNQKYVEAVGGHLYDLDH